MTSMAQHSALSVIVLLSMSVSGLVVDVVHSDQRKAMETAMESCSENLSGQEIQQER